MYFQLAFISFIVATLFATVFSDICKDINAIHELKISSSYKNTIQSYQFLQKDQLNFVTQELLFGKEEKYVSNFILGQFTEANGGSGQFKELSTVEDNIVKDFLNLRGDFFSVVVNTDHELSYLYKGKKLTFEYPLDKENVYDSEGNVIETRPKFPKATLGEYGFEASRRQIQLLGLHDDSFFALYYNEDSLKLFSGSVTDGTITYPKKTLVVPKVNGTVVHAKTYDSLFSFNEARNRILVIVTLDQTQKAAFEAEHKVTLNFNGLKKAPFLVVYNFDLDIESVTCLISPLYRESTVAHISGFDIRDDLLVLVGNEVSSSGLYFENAPKHSFYSLFNLKTNTVQDTRPLSFLLSGDFGGNSFKVRDVTFAPDGNTTRYLFAGDIIPSDDNKYNVLGAVFLSDGYTSYRDLIVGESGSNVVRRITRYYNYDEKKESVILDLYMNGPDSPEDEPDTKQLRVINAGFWMLDCSSPSKPVEIGARVLFYSIVAGTIIIFITSVSIFGTNCFREIKEKRQKKKSEEESELIVNRTL